MDKNMILFVRIKHHLFLDDFLINIEISCYLQEYLCNYDKFLIRKKEFTQYSLVF